MSPRDRSAYVLVLPSMFTTGNLFCGFFSIVRSFNEDFEKAAYAILLAGIFDVLDGRVARITKSTSKFGVEYDSISDVVSFGVAPAILAYVWTLQEFGNLGWAAAFFFAACGALRLARFNTISDEIPKSYFLGLPIPAAANLVASLSIMYHDLHLEAPRLLLVAIMFGLGLLMVSSVRYRSFKDFDLRHRRHFFELAAMVGLVALAAVQPAVALLSIFVYYASWGPIRESIVLVARFFSGKSATASLTSTVNEEAGKE